MKKQELCIQTPFKHQLRRLSQLCCYCLLSIFCSFQLSAQSGGFNTSGSAIDAPGLGVNCFQITDDIAPIGQSGSAISFCNIDLDQNFAFDFDMNFGTNSVANPGGGTNVGADGMAFLLQPNASALGGTGGGIGYETISPSLAVEFDDFQNAERNDPGEDHIGVQRNGDTDHQTGNLISGTGVFTLPPIEDGLDHSIQITWNATTNTLQVFFDDPVTPKVTVTEDIVNTIFGGNPNVFWGFTGATATFSNVQTVCLNSFIGAEVLTTEITTNTGGCTTTGTVPTTGQGTATANVSCGVGPFTFLWSDGQTTQTASGLVNGTYTVTVTDALLASAVRTVTITSSPDSNNDGVADACPCVNSCPTTTSFSVNTDLGVCGATVSLGEPVSNCTLTLISSNEPALFPVNTTTVTRVFEDPNDGSQLTCTQTVTVTDNEPPMAVCNLGAAFLDGAGNATITAGSVDGGSSDNCGPITLSVNPSTFTCANIGLNVVELTVTSGGLSSTCNANVIIQDNMPITAICQDITVPISAAGTASITAAQVDNGSSDNCEVVTLSVSPSAFTCANVGANTVTLTVMGGGDSATCDATVTVTGNAAPAAVCQDITVGLDAAGMATITAGQIDNGSAGCGGAAVTLSANPTSFDCSNIGINTVTLTVMSGGLTTTCDAMVTIEDVVPTITCPADIVQDSDADICGAVVDYLVTASTTTDPITSLPGFLYLGSSATGNQYFRSSAVFTWQDAHADAIANGGHLATIPNAAVNDLIGNNVAWIGLTDEVVEGQFEWITGEPLVFTDWATNQPDDGGNPVVSQDYVRLDFQGLDDWDDRFNDETLFRYILELEGGVQVFETTGNYSLHSEFPIGTTNVCYEAFSACGVAAQCCFDVTIEDNTAPTAICQNITIPLDNTGAATITAAQVDNGSNDACGVTLSATPLAFGCADIGTNNVTLTATDPDNNATSCTAVVTIENNTVPTAICQNITIPLDNTGAATITAAQVDNGSNDACGVTLSATPLTFGCANVGTNNVTLTVTDSNNNATSCTAVVTIEDNTAPTAICQNITIPLDNTGSATITAAQVDNGSNDACGVTLSATPLTFGCADVGANNVTLTVTDSNNNTTSCTAVVTIEDVVPVITCPADIVQDSDADICGAVVDYLVTASTTIDPITSLPGFTYLGSSATGNQYFRSNAVFTWQDAHADAIANGGHLATIPNAAVNDLIGNNIAWIGLTDEVVEGQFEWITGEPLVFTDWATNQPDDGGNPVVNQDYVQLNFLLLGDWDDLDNDASLRYILELEGGVQVFETTGNYSLHSEFPIGTTNVCYEAFSACGVAAQCCFDVTIEDNTAPTAICQDITIQLDNTGAAMITAAQVDNGSNDACGVTLSATPLAFGCANVGTNNVTLTATDPSGNATNCTAAVTVQDVTPPVALCSNVTAILSATAPGMATVTAGDVDAGSTDACGIGSLSLSQTDFSCANVGTTVTVTLTVTDVNNNVATCTADVVTIDQTPPTANCQPFTAALDANGIATIELADVLASATDNCGLIPGGQLTQDAFNCGDLGPILVTASVTDVNGLTGSCTETVTVVDLIPPTAVCQDIIADLDVNGFRLITAAQIDNGSSDNCNMTTLTVSPNSFFCGNVGDNPVTLVVTDQSNNVSTCTANVLVRDLIAPMALCQAITVALDANGNASITPSQVDNGSNDACGISSLVLNQTDFSCSNLGVNTVLLTVTDVNGNVSNCTETVTVIDDMPAAILCRPPVNTVNDQGVCGADVLLLPPLVIEENCSIVSISNDAPALFDLGTTLVTWTFIDVGGNPSTCEQTVTINDTEAPVIDCGNSFTAYTSWTNCGYPSYLLEAATATDNCGIPTITDDAPDFFPPGQYMVNYTATDAAGNTATCMQWVKIYDTTLPKLVTCPEDQTIFATTDTGANAEWELPTGMDNCPGDIILVEANGYEPGDFFELGDTEISYRLYDQNGQYVDCEFTISVIPAPLPLTINCLETIEVSSQNELNLQLISWNSPLVQSLCDDCEILKSDDFSYVGGFEGHNYYLFDSAELSWNEANQMAHSLGGYLTVISSYKEGLFLSTELEEDVNAWIGLADLQGNGEWIWSDDTEFEMPNWQEELTFIEDTPTAFALNNEGEWVLQTMDESNYFLFEIPCYDFEITNDNDLNIAEVNSETTVSYEVTDMCGETVNCDFQLIFTDQNVDYCEEGAIVTDSAAQHFIDRLILGDVYTNESGNDYGYGDFTDEYILLTPGEILDIYAEFGPLDIANPLYCRMWIDLNADGDFYDEGEMISQAIDVLDMEEEWTVPSVNSSITETRLRIAVSRFGYPAPCGTFENGEMEDYTITFDHEDVASFMQVNLQGHREGFAAHLKWVTQTSLDINSYDVERSTDGINFEKINTGLADATTQNMPAIYNDTDEKPALGMNYYRLQVFPKDGAAFYTNVVALQFNEQKQRITIYPNPADEYVMVHLEDATEKAATLRLYNVFGQLMKQMKFDELPNGDIRIALDNLIDGSYYLHLTIDGQHTIVEKLVVDKLNGYRPDLD